MKRRPKHPLLVTRCDLCDRRRTCAPIVGRRWLCRQCIRGLMPRLTAALRAFAGQAEARLA